MIESEQDAMFASMVGEGARIQKVREIAGLTQAEFARTLGVTRGAVGNWERGKGIKRENLALISDRTGISFDWLATGRGDELKKLAGAMRGDGSDTATQIAERLMMLMARAFELLGNLPPDEAERLAAILLEAAHTPPGPQESVPEAARLRLVADTLIRFRARK